MYLLNILIFFAVFGAGWSHVRDWPRLHLISLRLCTYPEIYIKSK
jgi:hypothetical protein